ncbi:MAG: HPr(Ser) kinase/phosphatase [Clostridia bacterium]|nr:HPr(Ser) kinase/phosphatase [Clostridia bacterium]
MNKTISVNEMAKEVGLEIVYAGRGDFTAVIADIHRPAIQMSGYFEYFSCECVQMFGTQEMKYVEGIDAKTLEERLRTYFAYPIPVIVVCSGNEVPGWMIEHAQRCEVPILRTNNSSGIAGQTIMHYLMQKLAPEISVHGNLVDVHNVGILIRGESGMGKSEISLELIKRGHVLVADDTTVIRKVGPATLVGMAPEATRGLMEIRGLGVMDIRRFYGWASVLDTKNVQIVVDMESWVPEKDYDRLGFDTKYEVIMGVKIPHYVVPVRPGRNIAVVLEATAMDYRSKRSGFDIEKELNERLKTIFR